ncbi:isoprenoid synthase domain-containing protein [Aspergillus pseudoustus]|uniref:Terpene synthase n=1 Tax=Aspergillus pseudoustus TaxID=1810923 RepID=A0ABR4KFI0_9EURO
MIPIPEEAVTALRAVMGQTALIPDLCALLYPDWWADRHEHEAQVRHEIHTDFLERWWPDDESLKTAAKKGELVQEAGYFWGGSSLERFRIVAQFMIWLFMWDDEFDCGNLQTNSEQAAICCRDTLAFLKWCLEVPRSDSEAPPDGQHNSGCLQDILAAMQASLSHVSMRRFADSLYAYVNAVGEAQQHRLAGLPLWNDYIDNRLLNIAMFPCILAIEYSHNLKIPAWVIDSKEMQSIARETVVSVVVANDIFSFKKEALVGQIDNALFLKVALSTHRNFQLGLEETIQELVESRDRFKASESQLLGSEEYLKLPQDVQEDVKAFILVCKFMIVGNVKWSKGTKRYLLEDAPDGVTIVNLKTKKN